MPGAATHTNGGKFSGKDKELGFRKWFTVVGLGFTWFTVPESLTTGPDQFIWGHEHFLPDQHPPRQGKFVPAFGSTLRTGLLPARGLWAVVINRHFMGHLNRHMAVAMWWLEMHNKNCLGEWWHGVDFGGLI